MDVKNYKMKFKSSSIELVRKTFTFDVFSPVKFGLSVVILVLAPLIVLFMNYFIPDPSKSIFTYPFFPNLFFLTFLLSYSIPFQLLILIPGSTMVSDEFTNGTMLVLESQPLSRFDILLVKWYATLLYNALVSLVTVSIISATAFLLYGFYDTFAFFLVNLTFCLFFTLVWGTISLGVSTLIKISRIAVILSFLIFLFTVFFTFSTNFILDEYYGDWNLYLVDLNYNFANIYVGLCKSFGFTLPTKTISPFTHFDTFYILILNKNTGVLVESNYFHPVGSVIYLVVIALILIGVGYWRFKSREIL